MPDSVIKVLLVEDSAADAQVTSDMLVFSHAPRCELLHAERLSEAQALLAAGRFDIILLDLGLPDSVGLEGVRALRAAAPETAIIVLSGTGSETLAVDALQAGAQDYLFKGRADDDALQRSMRFAIARRQADVAQRRLAALVESSNDAILTKDFEATITSWNAGAERLYGYSHDEAVGQPVAILVPPERHGEELEILARVLAGERVYHYETARVCKDGTTKIVALTVSAIRDGHGGVIAISSIERDITASRRAAQALQASEERFRVAFDEALIGMMIIGLDARYARVNDAFCAIVGHARETLIGMSQETIAHPDDVAADAASLRALLAGELKSYTREKRFVHAAGHPVWVSLGLTLIQDGDGRPLHFIAQAQDITDRRSYESQLKHLADHDPLTGLLNRRSFERELTSHVARIKRFGTTGAVLMLDLDNFKYHNDTEGHSAGDNLIVGIAHALRSRLRDSDVIARLGGDEFAVLLPKETGETADVIAKALLQCIREQTPQAIRGERRRVTASIGIACFDDRELLTAEDIMINADLAMYDAKKLGRDRIAHYRKSSTTARGSRAR